jgi:hypothetical protein
MWIVSYPTKLARERFHSEAMFLFFGGDAGEGEEEFLSCVTFGDGKKIDPAFRILKKSLIVIPE